MFDLEFRMFEISTLLDHENKNGNKKQITYICQDKDFMHQNITSNKKCQSIIFFLFCCYYVIDFEITDLFMIQSKLIQKNKCHIRELKYSADRSMTYEWNMITLIGIKIFSYYQATKIYIITSLRFTFRLYSLHTYLQSTIHFQCSFCI